MLELNNPISSLIPLPEQGTSCLWKIKHNSSLIQLFCLTRQACLQLVGFPFQANTSFIQDDFAM